MKRILPILFIAIACSGISEEEASVSEKSANRFFEMYKVREDWKGFQNLYAEDMVFEDVIFRYRYNKEEFINFYNWPDSLLAKHPDYPEVMVLEDLALTDSSVVGRGYFTPFYYAGVLYDDWEHMRFTIWLYFNKEGKIKKHIDYIEYPPAFLKAAADRLLKEESDSK